MLLTLGTTAAAAAPPQLNPHPYEVANAADGASAVRTYRGEYFDVDGPIETSQYSLVNWRSQPVPLPREIVVRFHGKVMAITGYETNIVHVLPNGTETNAPCYELYNHHYSGWLHSSAVYQGASSGFMGPHGTALRRWVRDSASPHINGVPHVQVFSEGNGNEHRRSFRGYPLGYAQLIQSPAVWANMPMIIDINKRLTDDTSPGVVAALQPRKSTAPREPSASYNGILECPCTTRKDKIAGAYQLIKPTSTSDGAGSPPPCAGMHAAVVETANECFAGAEKAPGTPSPLPPLSVINDTAMPVGCWLSNDGGGGGGLTSSERLVFNQATGVANTLPTSSLVRVPALWHICRDLRINEGVVVSPATTGPANAAFHASVCAAAPKSGLTPANNPICNFSWYGGGLLCCGDGTLLLDADQQVPAPMDTWRLKYRFYFEEVADATANATANATTDATADATDAIDADADAIVGASGGMSQPRNLFRVWWSTEAINDEYSVPKSAADCLDPSTPTEACTHTIRSRFHGRDMLDPNRACMALGDEAACANVSRIEASGGAFKLLYAAAHCHAPACLSMELWDADTNTLLCRNVPKIGSGSRAVHDEKGFVVGIAPCVWGSAAEGLRAPPQIRLDANYTSIKRVNSTHGHWGVMALWQCRGAYAL